MKTFLKSDRLFFISSAKICPYSNNKLGEFMKKSLIVLLIGSIILSSSLSAKPKEKSEKIEKRRNNTALVVGAVGDYFIYKHYKNKKERKRPVSNKKLENALENMIETMKNLMIQKSTKNAKRIVKMRMKRSESGHIPQNFCKIHSLVSYIFALFSSRIGRIFMRNRRCHLNLFIRCIAWAKWFHRSVIFLKIFL